MANAGIDRGRSAICPAAVALGLAWMPGSRQLLFSSKRTGMYALWTLDIDGGALTPVATGGEAAIQPSVSQNGKVIVYVDASFPSRVIKASRNGSGVFEETAQVLSPNSQSNSAQFSPDGTRIVFASNRSGTWELWTALADGSNQTQLTEFDASLVGSPRWSPNGRSIVFAARQGAHAAISIVSAEGGKPKILSSKQFEDKRPGWSPTALGCSSPLTGAVPCNYGRRVRREELPHLSAPSPGSTFRPQRTVGYISRRLKEASGR